MNRKFKIFALVTTLLVPSILGICTCLFCVCNITWAWFSVNVQTPLQIASAYYEVTVDSVMVNEILAEHEISISGGDAESFIVNKTGDECEISISGGDAAPVMVNKARDEHKISISAGDAEPDNEARIQPTDGSYELQAGKTYTITLHANGSVKDCSGYCLIKNESETVTYYTQAINPGESIEIILPISETGMYTFTGVWGSTKSDVLPEEIIHDTITDTKSTVVSSGDAQDNIPAAKKPTTNPAPEDSAEPLREQTE